MWVFLTLGGYNYVAKQNGWMGRGAFCLSLAASPRQAVVRATPFMSDFLSAS